MRRSLQLIKHQRIFLGRTVEFPKHHYCTKRSCFWFGLLHWMTMLPLRGSEGVLFRESALQQWPLLDCWHVSNWRSLNKSWIKRRPVTNSHDSPPGSVPHTSHPVHTHSLLPFPLCGNTLFSLFIPFCPPRWTHLKPPLYEQNKLSWKCAVHITPP